MKDTARYMNTRQAAAWLGLSPRTLDAYRLTGEGPPFYRFGRRILYRRRDLGRWAAARRMNSTSASPEDGARAAPGSRRAPRPRRGGRAGEPPKGGKDAAKRRRPPKPFPVPPSPET